MEAFDATPIALEVALRNWGKPATEVMRELQAAKAFQHALNNLMPVQRPEEIDLGFFPFVDALSKRIRESKREAAI